MRPAVRIAAVGHCSALGPNLGEAAAALRRGAASAAGTRSVLGRHWPWFGLALADGTCTARAREAITRVGRELAANLPAADWATTALFVASSSLQMGELEVAARAHGAVDLPPDAAAFSQQVAAWLGITGTPWTFSTTCTSGLAALDAAATLIRSGEIERAVVVAVELANDTTLAGFAGLGLLADTAAGPGLVLGEAVAGVLLTAAPAAAAQPGWHVAACRLGIDGHSPTGPAPDGAAIAATIRSALTDARLDAAAIDLLKAHAGGLDATAAAEARALAAVFGSSPPPQRDFKHRLGHTLGASGLAELGLLLASADDDPTAPRHVLLNLIGFGGSIGALILSRTATIDTTGAPAAAAHEESARVVLALDRAALGSQARAALGAPLRRAGPLVELCLAGVAACVDADAAERPRARSTAVLFASRSGPRAAFRQVLEDLCLRAEDPMPFDFLATQAMLATLPLKKRLPELEAACYLPLTGDTELQWQRMRALAHAWLASGRHDRVLLGMVEPGDDLHRCEWRSLTLAAG